MIRWSEIELYFARDGSLRDLYVPDADEADWNRFLEALAAWNYSLRFSRDGIPQPLPQTAQEAFSVSANAVALLHVDLGGPVLACHFFSPEEIELDLEPSQFCERNFPVLLTFIRKLGRQLSKQVVLTPENQPELAFLAYEPASDQFRVLRSVSNRVDG